MTSKSDFLAKCSSNASLIEIGRIEKSFDHFIPSDDRDFILIIIVLMRKSRQPTTEMKAETTTDPPKHETTTMATLAASAALTMCSTANESVSVFC